MSGSVFFPTGSPNTTPLDSIGTHYCAWCGVLIPKQRKYCCNAHKQAAYRMRKRCAEKFPSVNLEREIGLRRRSWWDRLKAWVLDAKPFEP